MEQNKIGIYDLNTLRDDLEKTLKQNNDQDIPYCVSSRVLIAMIEQLDLLRYVVQLQKLDKEKP